MDCFLDDMDLHHERVKFENLLEKVDTSEVKISLLIIWNDC